MAKKKIAKQNHKLQAGKTFMDQDGDRVHAFHTEQAETEGVKIEDPGTGHAVIIRQFEFAYAPHIKASGKHPSKEEVITKEYIKYLENLLWLDDLEMILDPKVVFESDSFKVFATCKPRKGRIISQEMLNQMKPLQDMLHERK